MQTVFLDYKTVDPGDLDLSQLKKITPDIVLYDNTRPSEALERIKDAVVIINNKVRLGKQELKNAHKTKLICLILVNIIYVDDEVNMPARLVEKIRIRSIVNIFDDIVNFLDNTDIKEDKWK